MLCTEADKQLFRYTQQAAMKDYWCERPSHFKEVPIALWKNISQSTDGCRIYNYPWQNVTAEDILVSIPPSLA